MSIKLPIRKCAFAVSSVRELNGPEVNEGCAHLPCLGSAISLCLEHWQPLGGISIPPREEQIPAVAGTWEDRCTQEPANI